MNTEKINIYYSSIGAFDLTIVDSLPIRIQEKINKYKFEEDKLRSAVGKYILRYGLSTIYNCPIDILDELRQADKNSKPYIKNKEFFFNISHSNDFVVCALSNQEVGIDIEMVKVIEPMKYESVLNDRDKRLINRSVNPMSAFFKIWSIKEAVMKADGRGMQIDAKQIQIHHDSSQCELEHVLWQVQPIQIHSEYACYIATKEQVTFDTHQVAML